MADLYEFHVAGRIGPVIRSALPELATGPEGMNSVLSGAASGHEEVDRMLRRLDDAGLTATHIVITDEQRWRPQVSAESTPSGRGFVPVVDDDSSQYDVLE
ncbi:MAG: hypothetical protein ABJD68_01285 [Nakamurella sp.]